MFKFDFFGIALNSLCLIHVANEYESPAGPSNHDVQATPICQETNVAFPELKYGPEVLGKYKMCYPWSYPDTAAAAASIISACAAASDFATGIALVTIVAAEAAVAAAAAVTSIRGENLFAHSIKAHLTLGPVVVFPSLFCCYAQH